ncbi:tetratricopeptide repeat protein [Tunicatimonas pelagia]|uniref:tetratricopeptide repeat protein n=1 Tax=Tunicatimonas pelagia TaxID=931531 RepID=UPI002666851A|nr:tetratricopeptide repeat protein [Tunicatimonas pelagia]WKN45260.1 tetratricopeptide repeat protein [Tunicatimonas pelagia]
MMYLLLLFFSFTVSTPLEDENTKNNTLRAQADSLYTVAENYYDQGQTTQSITTLQNALPIYENLGDSTRKSDVFNNIGFFYTTLGELDQGISYFKQALRTDKFQQDTSRMIGRIKNIGIAYQNKGFYQTALSHYLEALQFAQEADRGKSIASISNSIALLLQEQDQIDKSLFYHKMALQQWKSLQMKDKVAYSYNNIGVLYDDTNQYDSALHYYFRALEQKQQTGSKSSQAITLYNIGNVYLQLDSLEKAQNYLLQALPIQRAVGNKEKLTAIYNSIAEWYLAKQNLLQAIAYMDSARQLIQQTDIRTDKLENWKLRIDVLEQQQQFGEANTLLHQWAALRDSLFNEEKVAVVKTQSEFELNQANQEKELARQEATLAQTEREQQRLITIFLGLVTTLLFVIGVVIWNNRRKIRQKNAQLQQKNQLIELQKSDIRHRTQNVLERVVYVLQLVSQEVDDEEQKFQIKRGENMIFALSNLEETLYELEDEEQVPVAFFFNKLLNELLKSHTLKAKFNLDIGSSLVLPIDVVIPLALITAELVTNAIKHAFAEMADPTLWITIRHQGSQLHLLVRDNGAGFSEAVIAKGFGQRLIRKLVKHLDGMMDYTTQQGTEFSLIFPIKST